MRVNAEVKESILSLVISTKELGNISFVLNLATS